MTPSLIRLANILLLVGAVTQTAHSQLIKDGKAVTGPNIASKQGFSAQLWLTEREEFFREFAQGGNIKFDGTTDVHRNIPAFVAIFITGPGIDPNGAANVTADVTVRKPDGSIYFEGKDAPCWSGKYPYAPDSTQVADAKLKLRIEPKDPAGKYSVDAVIHDRIRKVDLLLKKTFDVAQ